MLTIAPELAAERANIDAIVAAWPHLSEQMRTGILAMVRSAMQAG